MNRNIDISPEEFETIERYILKDMPQEEYDAFTLQLQNDPELQHKTETVKLLFVGIKETTLKDKIDHFHEEIVSSKNDRIVSSGKVLSMKRWMIAASVIGIA